MSMKRTHLDCSKIDDRVCERTGRSARTFAAAGLFPWLLGAPAEVSKKVVSRFIVATLETLEAVAEVGLLIRPSAGAALRPSIQTSC